jgi:hypothetical protein
MKIFRELFGNPMKQALKAKEKNRSPSCHNPAHQLHREHGQPSGVGLLHLLAHMWRTTRAVMRARAIARARSPRDLLRMASVWTPIQQVKNAGSTQTMRMDDGNFIMLSVGYDTTRIFFTPRFDSVESFVEVASFPIGDISKNRREAEEAILNRLRARIGWPKSTAELRAKIEDMVQQDAIQLVERLTSTESGDRNDSKSPAKTS